MVGCSGSLPLWPNLEGSLLAPATAKRGLARKFFTAEFMSWSVIATSSSYDGRRKLERSDGMNEAVAEFGVKTEPRYGTFGFLVPEHPLSTQDNPGIGEHPVFMAIVCSKTRPLYRCEVWGEFEWMEVIRSCCDLLQPCLARFTSSWSKLPCRICNLMF